MLKGSVKIRLIPQLFSCVDCVQKCAEFLIPCTFFYRHRKSLYEVEAISFYLRKIIIDFKVDNFFYISLYH